jgi:hypothetical protein
MRLIFGWDNKFHELLEPGEEWPAGVKKPKTLMYANKRPFTCPKCAIHVELGQGFVYPSQNSCGPPWHFYHEECLGERPWQRDKSGWIYAITGVCNLEPNPVWFNGRVKPESINLKPGEKTRQQPVVKVGSTSRHPVERASELPFMFRLNSPVCEIWASLVEDRRVQIGRFYERKGRVQAENEVHRKLDAYRIIGFYDVGREVYISPLAVALEAIRHVTGETPEKFWPLSDSA